jgi:hypothetical protein
MRIEGQARLEGFLSAADVRLALGPTQPRTQRQLRAAAVEGKQPGSSFSTVLCCGFDSRGLIADRDRFFCCGVQMDSGTHPASYAIITRGCFTGYKSRMTWTLYRMSIKSFPDYKHLLQENYVEYKHIFFFKM